MEFTAFQAALSKPGGELPPAILFQGAESFLRDLGVEILKEGRPGLAETQVRLPSSETTWPALLSELHTPSFFGSRKLVVLVDEGNWLHNNLAGFKEYLRAPSPASLLAALVPSDKALGLGGDGGAWTVECRSLKPGDMARWVQNLFQRRDKTIDRAALDRLVTRGGPDLAALAGHVEKLASYIGRRASVTAADVDALVKGEPSHKDYELSLAAAKKQTKKAIEVAHALLAAGEPPQKILWKLAWQYRKLVEAKKLLLSGRHRFEVTSLLQITFYPDEFLRMVDDHSLEELLEKHGEILAADLALKTGDGRENAVLEGLVARLSRSGRLETQSVK